MKENYPLNKGRMSLRSRFEGHPVETANLRMGISTNNNPSFSQMKETQEKPLYDLWLRGDKGSKSSRTQEDLVAILLTRLGNSASSLK